MRIHGELRRASFVAGLTMVLTLAPTAAFGAWLSDGGGSAGVTATSVNKASKPSVEAGEGSVTISWARSTLVSGDSVGYYDVLRDGDPVCSSADVDDATASCTDPEPVGHEVTYQVVAGIGTHWTGPASDGTLFTYDSTAPDAPSAPDLIAADDTGSSDSDNITSKSSVTVTGTAEAGSTVRIYREATLLSSGTATDSNYSISITLVEGDNTIHATATDAAGNVSISSSITLIRRDSTATTVMGVSSTAMDRSYGVGAVIPVTVTFSEPVTVTGTPQLALATGSPVSTQVNYTSGTGTQTLAFNYSVAANNASPDLDYVNTGSLTLNGGTIRDVAGNNANLTLAAPGAAGSLGASRAIVIDGVAPTVSNVQLFNKTGGTVGAAEQGDSIVVTLSERLDASSVCNSWTNSGVTNTLTGNSNDVSVTINDGVATDTLTVASSSCPTLNFGSVALGANYVSQTVTFKGANGADRSSVSLSATGQLTVTLGSPNPANKLIAGQAAATPIYTPANPGAWKDVAGNTLGTTAVAGTSSRF